MKTKASLTAGPLGIQMTDEQAKVLEAVLKTHSADSALGYRKSELFKKYAEVLPGERTDVSWISTEEPDRTNEVVIAAGMDDSHFKLNPIVTMNHNYVAPPVGKSLWRKVARDGKVAGIKAKTHYPCKPDTWAGSTDEEWAPDIAFALIQAELLRGKSIGFLPLSGFVPDKSTREKNGWNDSVQYVIDKWLLLEYACTFLPVQGGAVVEAVSKSFKNHATILKSLGIDSAYSDIGVGAPPSGEVAPVSPAYFDVADLRGMFEKRLTPDSISQKIETAIKERVHHRTGGI